MTRARTTAGKRNVQQRKREKAQAKQERRAARQAAGDDAIGVPVSMSESELIEELTKLNDAVRDGLISPQEFEDRRETIRVQLEQLAR